MQVLVLRPIGNNAFDAARDVALSSGAVLQDTTQFKFPSLDPETERFLWRRKADLDIAIRMLDKTQDDEGAMKGKASQVPLAKSTGITVATGGAKLKEADAKAKPLPQTINAFLAGATAAQKTQISMINHIFGLMDADKDGLLSVSDVKAYFRTIGRNSSDMVARKWIRDRDLDQVSEDWV